ncbi:MAG: YkgJ family cysteine cluster protein [Thaumarchaeota archaeon]|nr:YkgJ family cysteine cluster protein [Nitrososphaerota archaeon]
MFNAQGESLVPWRLVENWKCVLCGKCCINHRVPLLFKEYARIEPKYGPRSVEPGEKEFYLRILPNGNCFFLRKKGKLFVCRIHNEKPYACRIFPFRISRTAKYGYDELSFFKYGGEAFHVYLEKNCRGIVLGEPSLEFTGRTIPRFLQLYLETVADRKVPTELC